MTALAELERVAGPLSLTDEEVQQNRSHRERYERIEGTRGESALSPALANFSLDELNRLVSQEAHDLVLYYEVSGQSGYENKYKFPTWPGLESGVTIGIGYDIGHNNPVSFESSWKSLLPHDDFSALAQTVGRKGEIARTSIPAVKSIAVAWEHANEVYRATTVPTFARLVLATFPNAKDLHPHSFGALFSLVYNRGASLNGERRRHMKNIHDHMQQKRFGQVAREIRAMKVLWGANMSGLHKRRDSEAMLFEQGLIEADRPSVRPVEVASAPVAFVAAPQFTITPYPGAPGTQGGPAMTRGGGAPDAPETFEGDWAGLPDDITDDMPQTRSPADIGLDRAPRGWTAVNWVQQEDNSTEYRHVLAEDRVLKDCDFELTARHLEVLFAANAFEPDRSAGKIIFGLRGATLLGGTTSTDDRLFQIDRDKLRLKEARPDHSDFRCVIGVYDLPSQRLSGFIASTVPKRDVVYGFAKSGRPACNLLPCGCYTYEVGPHRGKAGCLRETEPYAVLRNRNNMSYDVGDDWDHCFPADNIHPSFADPSGSAKFSSLGCQVVQGNINKATGEHTGVWAKFRTALGLLKPGTGDHKKRFSYVLLTGIEAAIASRLTAQGHETDEALVNASLARLRHGSRGAKVTQLQTALNIPATGTLDAATKFALAKLQAQKLKWADGVYAPAMDQALSLNIYAAPEPPLVVAALDTTVRGASGDPDDELYREIGLRSALARGQPELAMTATRGVLSDAAGALASDALQAGRRIFGHIERSAHELLCGAGANAGDRASLQASLNEAAKAGPDAVTARLTDVLVASFGILNPIAALAARILVRKFVEPQLAGVAPMIECACSAWARDLAKRNESPQTE